MKTALLLAALHLCIGCKVVSYGGSRAGVQTISTFRSLRAGDETVSFYTIHFMNVGPHVSLNVQPIFPLSGAPLLKVGADFPLDPLLQKLAR